MRCVVCKEGGIREKVIGGADEENVEAEEAGTEEIEHGARMTKRMSDPKMPKEDEVKEHNLTHLPFRSWCRHCVRGRGKELPHFKGTEKPDMHELHLDFCFMGEETGGKK